MAYAVGIKTNVLSRTIHDATLAHLTLRSPCSRAGNTRAGLARVQSRRGRCKGSLQMDTLLVHSFFRKMRGALCSRTRHNSYRDWKLRCRQLIFLTCPGSLLYPLEGLYLIGLSAIDSTRLCRRLDSLLGRRTFGMCRLCRRRNRPGKTASETAVQQTDNGKFTM